MTDTVQVHFVWPGSPPRAAEKHELQAGTWNRWKGGIHRREGPTFDRKSGECPP